MSLSLPGHHPRSATQWKALQAERGAALAAAFLLVTLVFVGCSSADDPMSLFNAGRYERSLAAAHVLAGRNEPAAMNLVGVHYFLGAGVTRDFKQAHQWFERAARLDNPNAQRNLGLLYLRGLGVPQNYFLAYAWLSKASERGNDGARHYLALMGDSLTPTQMVKARHALEDQFRKHAAD